ncbi:putative C6 transcription factor [Aspergillus ambiguus]|uniref:Zn(II)2Cys6 transcription factor n=1 Tax=Aspergillus ambiguus TaxID=176160 RepID=UPI003CCDC371
MQTESTPSKPPIRQPSSLACVPCRRRHLKCDAQMPACSRCQASSTECVYVRSRRGLRNRNRDPPSQLLNDDIPLFNADAFADWLNATSLPQDLDTERALLQSLDTPQTLDIPSLTEDAVSWPDPGRLIAPDVAYDPMVQLYYQNFHRSHPVVVPRRALQSPLRERMPPYLLDIMRYVGAHYYPDPLFKESFRQSAYEVLSASTVKDGFKVQGMLLLAIVEHAHGREDSAYLTIETAITQALELGMNHTQFAKEHSGGDFILEESFRRTFWELYVVDGLLAAMGEQGNFRLYHQRNPVELPCAEQMYNTAVQIVPNTQTLDDMQHDWAFGDATHASSFAYRVQAVRNLGQVLDVNRSLDENMEARVEMVDATLFSSLMRLPSSQGGAAYDSSSLDEMVFQAEMINYLAMIYLHHPRSSMRFASFHARTSCTRLRAAQDQAMPMATELDLHSQKFLRAADLLSNLATLPSPIKCRTPFFTCALAMCVVVHTAGCLVMLSSEKQESLKARIQLGIGGLHVLGKVWPLARAVRQQMLDMYQEMGLR